MRSCHNLSAGFDASNLVSCAGLIPVMTLAERAGLHDLARAHVRVPGAAGSNADVKVAALVAGMVAGADTIDAMDLLRHGGMGRVSTAGRAPSTLGTFLRSFTFGHVRQLDAVASRVLVNLAARAPLLAGADQVAFVDIDDTIKATYGYAKQGAGYGYSKVKGLNALLAIVSTPVSAPVIAATRLRRGATNSAKGAARLVADALVTARKAGATGQVTVRSDSAYYNHDVIAAARPGRAGRPVLHLAPPRGLHRLGRVNARRRGHPPRPRDHREGHCRVEERPTRAPPVRADERERGMAGAGGHRVQPDPCSRDPGLEVSRPGDHRHHPRPAHRRAGPHRPLSPPAPSSPTRAMALGDRLAGDVHRRRRTTRLRDLTTQPQRAQPRTRSGRPGQTGTLPTPKSETTRLRPDQSSPKADRWIEAEGAPPGCRSGGVAGAGWSSRWGSAC